MPRDNSGKATSSQEPAKGGTTILAKVFNAVVQDIMDMLTDSVSRSGKGKMQADLDMGGKSVVNAKELLVKDTGNVAKKVATSDTVDEVDEKLSKLKSQLPAFLQPQIIHNGDTNVALGKNRYYLLIPKKVSVTNYGVGKIKINNKLYDVYLYNNKLYGDWNLGSQTVLAFSSGFTSSATFGRFYMVMEGSGKNFNLPAFYLRGLPVPIGTSILEHIKASSNLALSFPSAEAAGRSTLKPFNYGPNSGDITGHDGNNITLESVPFPTDEQIDYLPSLRYDGFRQSTPVFGLIIYGTTYYLLGRDLYTIRDASMLFRGAARLTLRNPCAEYFRVYSRGNQLNLPHGALFNPAAGSSKPELLPTTLELVIEKSIPAYRRNENPIYGDKVYPPIDGGRIGVFTYGVRGFSDLIKRENGFYYATANTKALPAEKGPTRYFAFEDEVPTPMSVAERDAGTSNTARAVSAATLRGLDQIKIQSTAPTSTEGRINSMVLAGSNLTLYEKTDDTTWTNKGDLLQVLPAPMSATERDAGTSTAARTVSAAILRGLDQVQILSSAPDSTTTARTGSLVFAGSPLSLYEKLSAGAWRNHGQLGGIGARELTDTENLNNITETGFYTKSTTPSANLNYPSLAAGTLTVVSGNNGISQTFQTLGDDPLLYIRGKTTSWNEWQQQKLPLNNRGDWALNANPVYAKWDMTQYEGSTYVWNSLTPGNSRPSRTNTDWFVMALGSAPKLNRIVKRVSTAKIFAASNDTHISDMDEKITLEPGNHVDVLFIVVFEADANGAFYIKAKKAGETSGTEIFPAQNAGNGYNGLAPIIYDNNNAVTPTPVQVFAPDYDPGLTTTTEVTFSLHVRRAGTLRNRQFALNRNLSNSDTYQKFRGVSFSILKEIPTESAVAHADAATRTDPIIVLDSGTPPLTLGALYSMLFVIDGGEVFRKIATGWNAIGNLLWGKFTNLVNGQSVVYSDQLKRWVNSWPAQMVRIATDNPSDSLAINTLAVNEKSGKGFLRKPDGKWETMFHMTPRAHASIAILKYTRAWNGDNVFYEKAYTWQSVPLNTVAMNSGNDVQWLRNNQFRLLPGKYAITVHAPFFSEGRDLNVTVSPHKFEFTEHARIKAILRLILGHKQTMIKGELLQCWQYGRMLLADELNLTNPHECEIQALNWRGYSWDTDPTNANRDTSKPVGTSDKVAFGGASGNAAYGDQDDAIVRIQKIGVADPIEDYSLRNKMIVGYSHIGLFSTATHLGPAVLDKPGERELYLIQKLPSNNVQVVQFDLTRAGDLGNFESNNKYFEPGFAGDPDITTLIWNNARTKLALFTPSDQSLNAVFHLYNISRPGEIETTQVKTSTKQISLQTGLTYRNAQFSANNSKLFVLASNATSFTIRVYELPTAGDIGSITATSGVSTHTFPESINPSYFTIVNDQDIFMIYGADANTQNEIIHYRLATAGDFTPTTLSQVAAADAIDGVNLKSIQWNANGRKLIAMDETGKRIIELGHL